MEISKILDVTQDGTLNYLEFQQARLPVDAHLLFIPAELLSAGFPAQGTGHSRLRKQPGGGVDARRTSLLVPCLATILDRT